VKYNAESYDGQKPGIMGTDIKMLLEHGLFWLQN